MNKLGEGRRVNRVDGIASLDRRDGGATLDGVDGVALSILIGELV